MKRKLCVIHNSSGPYWSLATVLILLWRSGNPLSPQQCFLPTLMGEFVSINLNLLCPLLILSLLHNTIANVQDAPLACPHNPKAVAMIFKHWKPLVRPITQATVLHPFRVFGGVYILHLCSYFALWPYKNDERKRLKQFVNPLWQICNKTVLKRHYWLKRVIKFKYFFLCNRTTFKFTHLADAFIWSDLQMR